MSLLFAALVALPPGAFAAPNSPGAQVATAPQIGFLFEVNTTGDGNRVKGGALCDADAATAGDQCTLRAAIQASNDNTGGDSIRINIPPSDPGCDAATGRCTINLKKALPDLSTNVTISGPGADKLTVRRDPAATNIRIFNVTTTGGVTLADMTISNGSALGGVSGGGVLNNNAGTVNIQNCAITDNEATEGGGVSNFGAGTVNISRSLLARNVARGAPSNCCSAGAGGGLANLSSGVVNLVNSTVVGNFAIGADPSQFTAAGPGQGGGLYSGAGTTNITNSTIASNLSTGPEGTQSSGGGVYQQSGIVNLKSTIVANNTAQASGQDLYGTFTSFGYNLVRDINDAFIPKQATDIFIADPKLGALGSRGGPTQTLPLLDGSPAIDKGTGEGLTGALSTDQRGEGFPRVVDNPAIPNASGSDDGADIGAFEVQPAVRFSVAAYNVSESGGAAAITVRLTGATEQTSTVRFTTSNGTATAGKDYTAKSGTLTFAAGETSKTFTVAITEDTLDEINETINLTLGSPTGGVTLGTPDKAVLTIADNDSAPTLSIGNATLTEGNSGAVYASFNVSLSKASGKTVTVKYVTANATAAAPADYEARAGTLSFSPGQTTRALTVGVRGDLLDETNETFLLNLSGAVNATIADAQGVCTITDNDATPSLSINNVSVTEVDSGTFNATLTVKLSAASGKTVTVNYATANGTASSSGDYVAKTGTLSFAPGQTTATIVVQVRGDFLKEANETFFVNLSGAVNATVADAQGQITITNDD